MNMKNYKNSIFITLTTTVVILIQAILEYNNNVMIK